MPNCAGCKWLDSTGPAGRGYCCMVERSSQAKERTAPTLGRALPVSIKCREPGMERCELYELGKFEKRWEGGEWSD